MGDAAGASPTEGEPDALPRWGVGLFGLCAWPARRSVVAVGRRPTHVSLWRVRLFEGDILPGKGKKNYRPAEILPYKLFIHKKMQPQRWP